MNKQIEWFCYYIVQEGLLTERTCQAVDHAIERTEGTEENLSTFVQTIIDNELATDEERLDYLKECAKEIDESSESPPRCIIDSEQAPAQSGATEKTAAEKSTDETNHRDDKQMPEQAFADRQSEDDEPIQATETETVAEAEAETEAESQNADTEAETAKDEKQSSAKKKSSSDAAQAAKMKGKGQKSGSIGKGKKATAKQKRSGDDTRQYTSAETKEESAAEGEGVAQENILKSVEEVNKKRAEVLKKINQVIVGQQDVLEQLVTAFFAGGHCVLMAVPGLAKTLMVRKLAETLSLDFQRIQFTPDLMPTDVTGSDILEEDSATGKRIFRFEKGPIFSNIVLADEINRTPAKTQAALLEAMEERRVTSGGEVYSLPEPFIVLATQNPVEQEGTYVLPEAQLDRFLFMVKFDYASEEEEFEVLSSTTRAQKPPKLEQVMERSEILSAQAMVWNIPVSDHVAHYATRLMRATRPEDNRAPDFVKKYVTMGGSPRAGQSLLRAAKANAMLHGMNDVACEDIRKFAYPVLRHRILLNFAATSEGLDTDDVIRELLDMVPEAPDK